MLKYRPILPLLCAALLSQAAAASAQTIDPLYRADVEKLLEVTGSTQLANQFMSIFTRQFVDGFKRAQPSMPDRALEVLLAFYSTDLGKKVIVSMPLILQEGATVGQQWAEKQMPRIGSLLEARLRAEGFIK